MSSTPVSPLTKSSSFSSPVSTIGSPNKATLLKPKIVSYYENIFYKKNFIQEQDISFWLEFFLLSVQSNALEKNLSSISDAILLNPQQDTSLQYKEAIHFLVFQCLKFIQNPNQEQELTNQLIETSSLGEMTPTSPLSKQQSKKKLSSSENLSEDPSIEFNKNSTIHSRRSNAILTLSIIFKTMLHKKWKNTSINSVQIMDLICGFNQVDSFFKTLLQHTMRLLSNPQKHSPNVLQVVIALLITILTGSENIYQNAIIDYFTLTDISSSIMPIVSAKNQPLKLKRNILICLLVLLQYRKYETSNVYVKQLEQLKNPNYLIGFSDIIVKCLFVWNRSFEKSNIEQQSVFSWISNYIPFVNWSVATETTDLNSASQAIRSPNEIGAPLFTLYELCNLSEEFVTNITKAQSFMVVANKSDNSTTSAAEYDKKGTPYILQELFKTCSILWTESASIPQHAMDVQQSLLYYSYLSLLVFCSLLEHKAFCNFIFDVNVVHEFYVYKKERGVYGKREYKNAGSLARILFDMQIQFLALVIRKGYLSNSQMTAQNRSILLDMISKSLFMLHTLICLSKKARVRLGVDWLHFWNICIRLCEILSIENLQFYSHLEGLLILLAKLLNLGVVFGDDFLPTRKNHDELLYEFVRQKQALMQFTQWVNASYQSRKMNTTLTRLVSSLEKTVATLNTELDIKSQTALTEEEVISLIKKFFDKAYAIKALGTVIDERALYFENPSESHFFQMLTKHFVSSCKVTVDHTFVDE